MSLIQRLTKCWYGKKSGEIVHRQEIAFFQFLVRKKISHIQLNLKHMRTGCSSDDRVKGHKMLNERHHLRRYMSMQRPSIIQYHYMSSSRKSNHNSIWPHHSCYKSIKATQEGLNQDTAKGLHSSLVGYDLTTLLIGFRVMIE